MRQVDKVAEMMAEGLTVDEIARALNTKVARVYVYFGEIKKALGWQAR